MHAGKVFIRVVIFRGLLTWFWTLCEAVSQSHVLRSLKSLKTLKNMNHVPKEFFFFYPKYKMIVLTSRLARFFMPLPAQPVKINF